MAHKGGDACDTRYRALANSLRLPTLDRGPPTGSHWGGQGEGGGSLGSESSVLSERAWTPSQSSDLYHKTTFYTTSCEALHASNLPFKMGC